MNRAVHSNDHTSCGCLGVLGCNGHQNTGKSAEWVCDGEIS